ncbi:ankyrin repeat-containing protein [Penicillium freii]|nr:ankyrin repeat-containing protein [Penicillium freii]
MDLGQLQLMELYLDSSTPTERRRLQNRLAQRRYREKKQEQKQKQENESIWSWDNEPIDLCTIYTESDKVSIETESASWSGSEIPARYSEACHAPNRAANNPHDHNNSSTVEEAIGPCNPPRTPEDRTSYFPPCRDSANSVHWPEALVTPLYGKQIPPDSSHTFSNVISQGEYSPAMAPPYQPSASAAVSSSLFPSFAAPFMGDTLSMGNSCSNCSIPATSSRDNHPPTSSQTVLGQPSHQHHSQYHIKSRTEKMPLMPLLHIAARNGNCSMLQTLLEHRAGVNECDAQGRTALHLAAEQGHEAAVSLLLDSGADNEICDADGKSPLFLAVSAGYTIVVDTIFSHRKKR